MRYLPPRSTLSFLRTWVWRTGLVGRAAMAGVAFLAAATVSADVQQIDAEALASLPAGVTLVDVRRADEWRDTGLVPGSVPLTFFDRDGNHDLEGWLASLEAYTGSADAPIVLICKAGVRSARIAELLDGRPEFTRIGNVTDGIDDWLDKGGDVAPWRP